MLKRLFHFHWFKQAWSSYGYEYVECRCGERRARSRLPSGYAPCAMWWLEGGDTPPTVIAPLGGSGLIQRLPRPKPTGVAGSGARYHG